MPSDAHHDDVSAGQAEFFTIRERHTGAAIYTELLLLLGEAALAGVIGGGMYDGLKASLQAVAHKWRERRRRGQELKPHESEIEVIAHVAIRLKLRLADDVPLITESISPVDDDWLCVVQGPENTAFRVRVGADLDAARARVLITSLGKKIDRLSGT